MKKFSHQTKTSAARKTIHPTHNSTTMKLILTFLILFPLITFCQNKDTLKTKRIAIGVVFSPDYSYRTLKPYSSSNLIAELRDSLEIPKFGFTTGLNLLLQLNKRLTLEAGLQFSNKGEKRMGV